MMNERDFYFSLDSGSRETVSYSPRFLKYKFHIYEYIFLPRHKYYTYIFFTLFRIGLIRGNEEREMCVFEWESECSSLLFILLSRLSIFYYRTQGRLFDVCVRKKENKRVCLSLVYAYSIERCLVIESWGGMWSELL
jgi:hypothetical protein